MTLAAVLAIARSGRRPNRDLVIAFVADEEDKGDWGAAFLAAEHPELFAGVGAAISESGAVFQPIAGPTGITRLYPIAAAERGTMHVRLTARGVSGHGSRPGARMAVTDLLDAVQRIAHHQWPVHLSPAVEGFLRAVAAARGIETDLSTDEGVQRCVDDLGEDAGVARFTIRAATTPTMLNAGYKVNVIPGVATTEIDVRCPPGFDDQLEAALLELIGPDVEYEFTAFQRPVAADPDSPWFGALADAVRRHDPEATVAPFCMGGGTDAKAFTPLGIECFGFAPLGEDSEGRREGGVHGVDERVPVESVRWGAQVIYDLLRSVWPG